MSVYALQAEPAEVMVKDNVLLTVSMAAMFGPGELIKRLAGVANTFCARLLQLRFFSGLTRTMLNPATAGVRSEGRRSVNLYGREDLPQVLRTGGSSIV